jgi:formylglycine-generating enzyme required for sulfatase activity
MPGVASGSAIAPQQPAVEGGIGAVATGAGGAAFEFERSYLVNLSTEPAGAILNFNGAPIASCRETPCKAELSEGSVQIVAVLEQYERKDTVVSVRQNNQSINIKLTPNFGVLEIKPAYSEGVGSNRSWNLSINGKAYSAMENRFSPGNYEVKLSHECYEDISFKAGINKGSREVFDMAKYLNLKVGGLALSAEKGGEPASEAVFVNGKRVGETPFSGSVPVCSEIAIGNNRDKVDVRIAYNQTVRHKHQFASGGGSMVFVKGGTFTMGCTSEQSDCDSDEKPTRRVTVRDFYIGKYEVTQKEWRDVMGSNPSSFKNCGDDCPVESVSWNDVQEFIRKLNQKTGKKYRLPTEAEWEYAARGGSQSKGYKYSGSNNIDNVAWYTGNGGSKTNPVGRKQPNELGIYDMSGNVWEWVSDWYGSNYYGSGVNNNPTGPSSGSYRVDRGGSWFNFALICRVANRDYGHPDGRDSGLGFRLALSP